MLLVPVYLDLSFHLIVVCFSPLCFYFAVLHPLPLPLSSCLGCIPPLIGLPSLRFMRLPLVCFYCLCEFVCVFYFYFYFLSGACHYLTNRFQMEAPVAPSRSLREASVGMAEAFAKPSRSLLRSLQRPRRLHEALVKTSRTPRGGATASPLRECFMKAP